MYLRELLPKKKPELFLDEVQTKQMPLEPSEIPSKELTEHFQLQRRQWLQKHAQHPLMLAQRDAVYLYARQPIALTRQIFSGGLHYSRGKRGYLLDLDALNILPSNACDKLKIGLQLQNVSLIGIETYVYTLPDTHFRIVKS